MEHLRYELSDKQNRIVQLETDYCYLQKRCEEFEKKNEDLYFLQSQVCCYSVTEIFLFRLNFIILERNVQILIFTFVGKGLRRRLYFRT